MSIEDLQIKLKKLSNIEYKTAIKIENTRKQLTEEIKLYLKENVPVGSKIVLTIDNDKRYYVGISDNIFAIIRKEYEDGHMEYYTIHVHNFYDDIKKHKIITPAGKERSD